MGSTPQIEFPSVSLRDREEYAEGTATIWIGEHALWVGRKQGKAPMKVLPLDGARLPEDAPELLEPLAKALHDFAAAPIELQVVGIFDTDPVVLFADERTDAATLRRVLTTARATDHRTVAFAIEDTSGQAAHAVILSTPPPIRLDRAFEEAMEESMGVRLEPGGIKIDGGSRSMDETIARLGRRGGLERRCVALDASNTVSYADVLIFASRLSAANIACLVWVTPAVDGDLPAPAPAPPPRAQEGEPAPAPAPAPSVPPRVGPHPAQARVAHWWNLATAVNKANSNAKCATNLAKINDAFDAEATELRLEILIKLEDECGDGKRSQQLRLRRSAGSRSSSKR